MSGSSKRKCDRNCPTPQKVRHTSKTNARKHALNLQAQGSSVDLKPYRCTCGAWHVGHSQASLGFRIREARRKGIA